MARWPYPNWSSSRSDVVKGQKMAVSPFLHPFARPAATEFIKMVEGRGAVLWDDSGREYIDGLAGLWYCNVGYDCQPIMDAVAAQMAALPVYNTFERFTNEPCEQLCVTLAELAPMPEPRVLLTSGGSEAVDSAFKVARIAHALAGEPDRTIIVSREPSYHGSAYGGTTATGLAPNREHFGPLVPNIEIVPHDDLAAMQTLFAEHGDRIAAVIAEPLIAGGGVYPPVLGYLEGVRGLCDSHGAFLILDEVVCGFGRLGAWWGSERYGVRPDLVTFAKGVTSGYMPLGGVLVGRPVADVLEADQDFLLRHGYTYSGHPTATAAGNATIAVTRDEGLVDSAVHIGKRLSAGLHELLDHDRVLEVRGTGAAMAVQMADDIDAIEIRKHHARQRCDRPRDPTLDPRVRPSARHHRRTARPVHRDARRRH